MTIIKMLITHDQVQASAHQDWQLIGQFKGNDTFYWMHNPTCTLALLHQVDVNPTEALADEYFLIPWGATLVIQVQYGLLTIKPPTLNLFDKPPTIGLEEALWLASIRQLLVQVEDVSTEPEAEKDVADDEDRGEKTARQQAIVFKISCLEE